MTKQAFGRRNIAVRQDLFKSLRMVAGQQAVERMQNATDAEIRAFIEASFVAKAAA